MDKKWETIFSTYGLNRYLFNFLNKNDIKNILLINKNINHNINEQYYIYYKKIKNEFSYNKLNNNIKILLRYNLIPRVFRNNYIHKEIQKIKIKKNYSEINYKILGNKVKIIGIKKYIKFVDKSRKYKTNI